MSGQLSDKEALRARYRRRIKEMHKSKQRQMLYRRYFRRYAPAAACMIAIVLMIFAGGKLLHRSSPEKNGAIKETRENDQRMEKSNGAAGRIIEVLEGDPENGGLAVISPMVNFLKGDGGPKVYRADRTAETLQIGTILPSEEVFYSQYAILIDLDSGSILAQKNENTRINPASMTKVLTVLVAAEYVKDLDDTFTLTSEITDYGFINGCMSAGFEKNEVVTIRDLFYGTILPSGADAAVGLAVYVAGSQDAFVELMNEKLEELGLSQSTHFTNCVGIYDENHYSTVYDMAMIMEAAMDNELCREVLSAHTYTTSKTIEHPEGIELSNWFLRRIEDKDCGGEVICGKTGYIVQSNNCAVSYAVDSMQKGYICATADANSGSRCIHDHAGLYKQFTDNR